MKKIILAILATAVISGCASVTNWPQVSVGMDEVDMVKEMSRRMGDPKEVLNKEGDVKIFYWAEHDMYTGRIRTFAYVTRNGSVSDEPEQVSDRLPSNEFPREWN